MNHPAKYTDVLIPIFARMLPNKQLKILDPFAGTGKIFRLLELKPKLKIEAIEIEPEWAAMDCRITLGDALDLKWENDTFDAIVTSPCYGNRMADTLLDKYKRVTYTSVLGRKLNPNNAGSLQWGTKYKEFHIKAWREARRVLRHNGFFILNIKDHIRAGKIQPVTRWHCDTLLSLGFERIEQIDVRVPSMRFGQNSDKRVEYESIIKFILNKRKQENV